MTLALFYVLGGATILGAMGVVATRNVVYAALFLLFTLMGVAGIFVLLLSDFLALVQVLIYGGGVVIVLLFAIMLTRLREFLGGTAEHPQWPLALLASVGLFVVLATAFFSDSDQFDADVRTRTDVETLGSALFTQWAIPFEVISVVLLVALVGAIVIARAGGRDDQ